MANHYLFGFMLVIACFALDVSSYPSSNEETTTLTLDLLNDSIVSNEDVSEERSLPDEQVIISDDANTKEIMEKIKAINEGLKRPQRRPQINWNNQPSTGGGYVIDKEILEKLQQIIASGKLHGLPHNEDTGEGLNELRHARQISLLNRNLAHAIPGPYIMNIPVLVMSPYNMYNPLINDLSDDGSYQTKQNPTSPSMPSFPFQFQWPFASFFPLLIKDPFLSILNGGGWSNLIEYGQSADVCNRKQKSIDDTFDLTDASGNQDVANLLAMDLAGDYNVREAKAIKKRTVSQGSPVQEINNVKTTKKTINTTRKPLKQASFEDTSSSNEGNLRFPFGDFTWFGNKKPVAPTPGFFINRLRVRKGGVAIAGPGGVATAGRGGAAIVGPGGLAYTQPGGLAVAGPAARVIALSPEIDLSSVVTRLQEQAATDGSVPNLLRAIPEGKVVATGPVVYYHSNQQQ